VLTADNLIGGTTAAARNLISNSTNGVEIFNHPSLGPGRASSTRVQNNLIGTDASGEGAIANGRGIMINNSRDTLIGGVGGSNVISNSTGAGVEIARGLFNRIQSNLIGLSAAGDETRATASACRS
jgi:hypothetical protein